MKHFNNNFFCSVAVRTTGRSAGFHEIIDMAIIPIDDNFNRYGRGQWFECLIQPNFPERFVKADHVRTAPLFESACREGLPLHTFHTLFDRWFNDLGLKDNKRLAPLSYNWNKPCRFLRQLFGDFNYERRFADDEVRELQPLARTLNDLAHTREATYPYPKTALSSLCHRAGVNDDYGKYQTSLHDAAKQIELYKKMLGYITSEMIPS